MLADHKHDMFSLLVAQRSLGDRQIKHWLQHLQIMLRYLHYMKQAGNAYGYNAKSSILKVLAVKSALHYQQLSMKIIMLALISSRRASLKVVESNVFLPKFFFTRELNDNYINIQHITSSKNLADIFTKSLLSSKKLAEHSFSWTQNIIKADELNQ